MTVPRTPQDMTDAVQLRVIDLSLESHRKRYLACLDAGHGMESDFYESTIDRLLDERSAIVRAAEARSLAATIKA